MGAENRIGVSRMKGHFAGLVRSLCTPHCLGMLALGIAIGATSILPLGLTVSEGAAAVIGSAIGAVAAVAGALAVVTYTAFNQGRNVADYLVHIVDPVVRGNIDIIDFYEKAKLLDARGDAEWVDLRVKAVLQLARIDRAKRLVKRIEAIVPNLKASAIRAYGRIEECLEGIRACIEDASAEAATDGGAENGTVFVDRGGDLKLRNFGLRQAALRLADDYGIRSANPPRKLTV